MNVVDELIRTFTNQELRQFIYFLKRNDQGNEREDLRLTALIRKGDIAPDANTNAHRQTRKRIKLQLEQFALLENIRYGDSSRIYGMVEIAKYLFRKNLYDYAWNYLLKAEQIAIDMEEYELLDFIYFTQISYLSGRYTQAVSVPDTLVLLEKRHKNMVLAKTDGDANSAYALLTYKMEEMFTRKLSGDIDALVNQALKQYQLEEIYDKPRIYIKVINIVCRILRDKKDYHTLRQYAMNSYNLMVEKQIFDKVPHVPVLEFLSQAYHSTIRTRDYEHCELFLKLQEHKVNHFKLQHDQYLYYDFVTGIGAADLYFCTNRLNDAKSRLSMLHKKYANNKQFTKLYFVLRVNLLGMHFTFGEYEICKKIFIDMIQYEEKRLLKEGGLEILLYTGIYGIMIYYENEDPDYAYYLLRKIKRKYADTFKAPEAKRENTFIRIMEKIINDASYITSKRFIADHDKFVKLKEYIPGDKEYISLNAWLTSKLTGKTYYECFLESVKSQV